MILLSSRVKLTVPPKVVRSCRKLMVGFFYEVKLTVPSHMSKSFDY
jgi:hypothetical protein